MRGYAACGMHGGDGCVSYNLGQVYMQQQLHAAPLYGGSAAGQAYVARYAVGVFEHMALRAQVPGWQAARTHTRAGIRAARPPRPSPSSD